MTWRELFALRPQWWIDLVSGVPRLTGSDSDPDPSDRRAHFWEEFRAGQHEADLRVVAGRSKTRPDESDRPK
jgi:hypothetical protein